MLLVAVEDDERRLWMSSERSSVLRGGGVGSDSVGWGGTGKGGTGKGTACWDGVGQGEVRVGWSEEARDRTGRGGWDGAAGRGWTEWG